MGELGQEPKPYRYTRGAMIRLRRVAASMTRPSVLSKEFDNEEKLFSPDKWIEHCWIRDGVEDRVKRPLLGELPSVSYEQLPAPSSMLRRSANTRQVPNGLDFRPSFQKDVFQLKDELGNRSWAPRKPMDLMSLGHSRTLGSRWDEMPEWLDDGPASTSDVIELGGMEDDAGSKSRTRASASTNHANGENDGRKNEQHSGEKANATPLAMPKTDEEFAALLGFTIDDLKLDVPNRSETAEATQSRFTRFFTSAALPSPTSTALRHSEEESSGLPSADTGAKANPFPEANRKSASILMKLFGDAQTSDATTVQGQPVKKGVMSVEELEKQLLSRESKNKEGDERPTSDSDQRVPTQPVEIKAEKCLSSHVDTASKEEPPLLGTSGAFQFLDAETPPNPMLLELLLHQHFPMQDQVLRMNSTNPLELYQRRLTFLHIVRRQTMPPPLPTADLPHPNSTAMMMMPAQAGLPPQTSSTAVHGGQGEIGENAGNSSPSIQKLFSQAGSRNETPLPIQEQGADQVKRGVMSLEELERSFLESSKGNEKDGTGASPLAGMQPFGPAQIPPPPPFAMSVPRLSTPVFSQPSLLCGPPVPSVVMPHLLPTAHHHHYLAALQQQQIAQQQRHPQMFRQPVMQHPMEGFIPPPPFAFAPMMPAPPPPPFHQQASPHLHHNSGEKTPSVHSASVKGESPAHSEKSATTVGVQVRSTFMPTSVMRKQAVKKRSNDGQEVEDEEQRGAQQ